MKVSFDFDGTLEQADVQEYAKELIKKGIEVWVVTTRWDENHKHKYTWNPTIDDLWEVVDRLGIPRWNVHFTCMEYKNKYLEGTKFVWHLDDNEKEFKEARKNILCDVPMIDVFDNDWQNQCNELITKKENDETSSLS